MIRLGLCSGACITRDIESVIAVALAARLEAIEWAADVHIGAADVKGAENAMMATLIAGLTTASYATLYRAGSEEDDFSHFDSLLHIASILQAPIMRLFAGAEDRSLVSVLGRLGDRAAERGITLCLSMSRGTCLDGYDRALRLTREVDHDFVRLAWEDLPGAASRSASTALELAGPIAALVIARCSSRDGRPVAIAADEEAWLERISAFKRSELDPKMGSFVLLGAARTEGSPGEESLSADAESMRGLIARAARS
jgi:hypothetical protein